MPQSRAFEVYRADRPGAITIPRLIAGLAVISLSWLAASIILVAPGLYAYNGDVGALYQSKSGILMLLSTFSGIWLGVWLAQRYVHREFFSNVFGWQRRIDRGDFVKGFAAVVLTSLLSEILIFVLKPEMSWGMINGAQWLVYALPVVAMCFIQTSSEELLFRGYLIRSLANRFRSPWIWALLPGLAFIAMHFTPDMAAPDIMLVVLTIGSLTVALTLVVYVTGNLGAGFGVHMGNNLFAFLFIAHQKEFGTFALLQGASVDDLGDAWGQALTLSAIGVLCVALMVIMLLAKWSPLRISGVH